MKRDLRDRYDNALAGVRKQARPKGAARRNCNLCTSEFRPRTAFDRFCGDCRQQSELLRFSEWLPGLVDSGEALAERICA